MPKKKITAPLRRLFGHQELFLALFDLGVCSSTLAVPSKVEVKTPRTKVRHSKSKWVRAQILSRRNGVKLCVILQVILLDSDFSDQHVLELQRLWQVLSTFSNLLWQDLVPI